MDAPAGHGTEVEVSKEGRNRACRDSPSLPFHRSASQPQYPHTYPGIRCCRSNSREEDGKLPHFRSNSNIISYSQAYFSRQIIDFPSLVNINVHLAHQISS